MNLPGPAGKGGVGVGAGLGTNPGVGGQGEGFGSRGRGHREALSLTRCGEGPHVDAGAARGDARVPGGGRPEKPLRVRKAIDDHDRDNHGLDDDQIDTGARRVPEPDDRLGRVLLSPP